MFLISPSFTITKLCNQSRVIFIMSYESPRVFPFDWERRRLEGVDGMGTGRARRVWAVWPLHGTYSIRVACVPVPPVQPTLSHVYTQFHAYIFNPAQLYAHFHALTPTPAPYTNAHRCSHADPGKRSWRRGGRSGETVET